MYKTILVTPLHYACLSGRSDIIETLMLAEADKTITNDERTTPVQEAEKRRDSELLK